MSFVGEVSKRAAGLAITGLAACASVVPLDETDASGAAGGDSLSGTTGGSGQPAELPQGSTTVTGVWYLDADRDGQLVAGIPFWYAEPGGDGADVVVQVVIDPRMGAALRTTFYIQSGELWSELSPVPGPYLWPIVYTPDENGEFLGLLSTPVGLDPTRNDFAFYLDDFRQQQGFPFQVWLTAVNLAGEGDSAGVEGTR